MLQARSRVVVTCAGKATEEVHKKGIKIQAHQNVNRKKNVFKCAIIVLLRE